VRVEVDGGGQIEKLKNGKSGKKVKIYHPV
jgi:hypothetical protein